MPLRRSLGKPMPNGAPASRGRGRFLLGSDPSPALWRSAHCTPLSAESRFAVLRACPAGSFLPEAGRVRRAPQQSPAKAAAAFPCLLSCLRGYIASVALAPQLPLASVQIEPHVVARSATLANDPANLAPPFRRAGLPGILKRIGKRKAASFERVTRDLLGPRHRLSDPFLGEFGDLRQLREFRAGHDPGLARRNCGGRGAGEVVSAFLAGPSGPQCRRQGTPAAPAAS
jgi:hypothetical protein